LLRWYVAHNHIDKLEYRIGKVEEQLGELIERALPRKEGIFYDGQVFDAYTFVSNLIKLAKNSCILIFVEYNR